MNTIETKIRDTLQMWAYDRGHSAGEDEVESIYRGMLDDFMPIFYDLEMANV